MLNTLVSYLSRFSRLTLITFALVVVLILVLFTINSASDNDTAEVDSSSATSSSEVAAEQNYTYDEPADESSSEPALVVINSGSAANSTDVATGNPQTFTANTIDLDSGDTITVVTTDGATQTALDSELENGHVSSTSTSLPSTGIGSTIAAALGLMVVTAAGISFMRSKKNLSYELLEINR